MQLLKEYDNVKMLSTDLDFSLNRWFVECKICSFLIGTKNFLRIRCISRIKSGLEYLHYVQKGWSNIFIARRSRNKITQFITIQIFIKGVHKTGSEYTGYLVYQFINFQLHIFLSRRHFPELMVVFSKPMLLEIGLISALHQCLFTSHIICFINSECILPNWYRWYCNSPFAPRCVVSRFSSALIVSAIFTKFLFFHQIIALQKLWKMLFISSKKLFSFSRYSIFCISVLPSFSTCRSLLWRMIKDKS